MKYIPVTGLNPVGEVKDIILSRFDAALISIAEPTTSKGWTIHQVFRQMDKIFKKFENDVSDLYLDSGGFQVLMGYITEKRIREYTDVYHFLLEKFHDKNMKIFSLDILHRNFPKEKILEMNDYSIKSSLEAFQKYPELKDKQLFVVQSRFPNVLEIWKELIKKHNVFNYYSRYSFGGLVGLKKETNAKFNHFAPMLMWLLSYAKENNAMDNIKHVHMLGQSSRLAIITAILIEEIFKNRGIHLEITMDSSEILRFSPIEAKLPVIFKDSENQFRMARDKDDLIQMFQNGAIHKSDNHDIEEAISDIKSGKISNSDFVEIVCQGIDSTIEFSHSIKDLLKDKIISGDIFLMSEDEFKELHIVFKQGRLAKELVNNLHHLKFGLDNLNDFSKVDEYTMALIKSYYE